MSGKSVDEVCGGLERAAVYKEAFVVVTLETEGLIESDHWLNFFGFDYKLHEACVSSLDILTSTDKLVSLSPYQ